ncbi:nitric oxide reductase activation protein NorD [Maritalea mediterranea]|uniref:VWA domain-containing protein n=1 Tax=Maritalea mediterranea TaxID=2909667 RepID=A0ABS9E8P5_9HYPH|nr:VWA domain-containing protein [Maritalea mediterranea]MCF4099250.1 VWA domain-containing protein [Maritalea mediterranea]
MNKTFDPRHIEPWEPEETIGKIWHDFAAHATAPVQFEEATVELGELSKRLAVFFRGLGGHHSVDIRPVAAEVSHQRMSFRQKLGHEQLAVARASFDGEVLRLPEKLAFFPDENANAALYVWLTASAAFAEAFEPQEDPLVADLLAIKRAGEITAQIIEQCPGLAGLQTELAAMSLYLRPNHKLPRFEAAVEELIQHALGHDAPLSVQAQLLQDHMQKGEFDGLVAPKNYCPFAPVPMWCENRDLLFSAPSEVATMDAERAKEVNKKGLFRARRHKSDQAERKDSLILHKFEAILSWAEFMNLNRRVDDDDNDDAKKAADDQDEIGLGQISKAPATRLKLHLDLAPEDVDRERLAGKVLYPEWDTRTNAYLPDHCQVFESKGEIKEDVPSFRADAQSARRINAVKRQFEALRPGRVIIPAQRDGEELDMDAAVRAQADLRACGESNDNIWRQPRPEARDLAVSILLDVSRSTEGAVGDRSVIEVEREALAALAWGLNACGDHFAINAFSSLKRDRVYLTKCKDFNEHMSEQVEQKIGALNPGFYTRLGAAIRHTSKDLAKQASNKRLLLVITDGKPNDLDHYEGRHGIEDTLMAIQEARRLGHAVYGITIDAKGQSWFARMFGPGRFSIIPQPEKLTQALPQIYRQLVIG